MPVCTNDVVYAEWLLLSWCLEFGNGLGRWCLHDKSPVKTQVTEVEIGTKMASGSGSVLAGKGSMCDSPTVPPLSHASVSFFEVQKATRRTVILGSILINGKEAVGK